ncbi:MAG: HAMP domain-containing histidine kinase [Oscillospiraceae bacterium]|nr:HAMP domain-containing histidine kinase [Oscillospiraceae bacterium]
MVKKKIGQSITSRWLVNSMGIVLLVLLVVDVLAIVIFSNYYANAAEQNLTTKLESVISPLSRYQTASGLESEIKSSVTEFDEKEKYELLALSTSGEVLLTSSGFEPSDWLDLSGYEKALDSDDGEYCETFRLSSGEKVMCCTVVLSSLQSEYGALMLLTSIDLIDNQILKIGVVLSISLLAIILLMLFAGLSFVRSIVVPVRQMCDISKKYAEGDFRERIEQTSFDEIGELAESINYMATELENSDKVKNEFISSVSHELRTPLTAIKGWSETALEMSDDPETIQKAMKVITGETERLSDMVEELLDFSRIEDGRFTLNRETCDILAELGEAVLIYGERAKSLGIKLEYYEPEMLPFVYGDRARLRQVFINIIDNAVKYSNSGGTVSVEAFEKNKEIVVLISDTGVGIAPGDLPKVKTKFYKANHTRRGSGIGLAVANEIVEMHGGNLTINSELGKGTTVRITLPITEQF